MQLGSVNSFSTNQVPLTTKPKTPISDAVTSLQTTKVQASYSPEVAYQSVDSDAEIGIYNPLISGKLPHGSASIADSSMEPKQAEQPIKNPYSVTPNQVAILEPIQVVDIARKPNEFVPNPDFFRRLPATAPSPIAMVFQQSWNHYYSEVHFNATAIGERIFGRPLTIGEQSNYAFTAAHERLKSGKLENGKKAGFQMLMERPEARGYQDNLLKPRLTAVENRRNDVYKDDKGNLTVGIGHKVLRGDNLRLGDIISDARVDQLYRQDSSSAMSTARQQAKNLGIVSSKMVVALADVNFQLGNNWTDKFPNAWGALGAGDFNRAITEIQTSLWATQTPVRTNNFISAITDYAPVHIR